nr:MAG TPA: hypothetical protein [Caudoviricetes sp.]
MFIVLFIFSNRISTCLQFVDKIIIFKTVKKFYSTLFGTLTKDVVNYFSLFMRRHVSENIVILNHCTYFYLHIVWFLLLVMLSHKARNRNDKPVLAQTIRVARCRRNAIRSASRLSCRKYQGTHDVYAAVFRLWKPRYVAIAH